MQINNTQLYFDVYREDSHSVPPPLDQNSFDSELDWYHSIY